MSKQVISPLLVPSSKEKKLMQRDRAEENAVASESVNLVERDRTPKILLVL